MKSAYRAMMLIGFLFTSATAIGSGTGVVINGEELSPSELVQLQRQIGAVVPPGNYLANMQTGCWVNTSTGDSGCIGGGSGSPADRWVGADELNRGGLRGVRPGPLSTYDFVR